jgi:hypothetical protein
MLKSEETGAYVCHNWHQANITDTPYKPDLRLYLTCDFNIDPMCWAIAHRYNGEYHFIDELCVENCSTQQAADLFFERYKTHASGVTIVGDASGNIRGGDTDYPLLRNRLTQWGMHDVELDVNAYNDPVASRVAAWNAQVCDDQQVRRLLVSPTCRYLIQDCENLVHVAGSSHIKEPTLKQIEANPKLKFTKHTWAAASYLVQRYSPVRMEYHPQHIRQHRAGKRPL